jgi:ABC-type antimicrobial peptide transport system permease subunit
MAEALNKTFIVDNHTLRIIGVVKDFNHMPLREQISSFFFRYVPNQLSVANIKLASDDITKTLSQIETSWKEVVPGQTMESYFLESKLEESLVSFRAMIKIFSFLGGLAIIISCLGLLAVVISTAESRIKEMGVRKVMGATSGNLALVLSRGFVKLIIVAIMIATPLAYILFEKIFLRVQYYRASVTWIDLTLGVLILLVLLIVTIGGQALKVARVNPVDTLKCE